MAAKKKEETEVKIKKVKRIHFDKYVTTKKYTKMQVAAVKVYAGPKKTQKTSEEWDSMFNNILHRRVK